MEQEASNHRCECSAFVSCLIQRFSLACLLVVLVFSPKVPFANELTLGTTAYSSSASAQAQINTLIAEDIAAHPGATQNGNSVQWEGVVKTYSIRLGTTSNWKVEFRKYYDDGQHYGSLLSNVLPGGIAPEVGTVPPANVYWAGVGPAVGYIMIANTGQNAAAASLAACNRVSATGVIISGVTDGGDYGPITWTSYYGNAVQGPIRDYSGYNVYGVQVIVVGRRADGSGTYNGWGPMYRTYSTALVMPYYIDSGSVCPIDDLSTDPNDPNGLKALSKQFNETPEQAKLTQNLEDGMDSYSLLSPETRNAEQCLAGRVASELLQENSGYKVTAAVRTLAYQAHLRKLWDKFFDLKRTIKKKPAIKQMCPTLIAKVEGEMGFRLDQDPTDPDSTCTAAGRNHCIRSIPADPNKDPKHAVKLAFDISQTAVKNYQNILLPPRTMATEANACKLTWGGGFTPIDRVHFLCCVK